MLEEHIAGNGGVAIAGRDEAPVRRGRSRGRGGGGDGGGGGGGGGEVIELIYITGSAAASLLP